MIPKSLERFAIGPALAGRTVLVAVSGGIDSSALLHGLAALRERAGLSLAVGHVHHGLRGESADEDQLFVQNHAARLGVECLTERVDPNVLREGGSNRERPSPQEAARVVRHAALDRMATASGADCVATAHTLDDQAETVLLRLFRGTTPEGLAGIAPVSADSRRVRPLLEVSRSEIEAWAKQDGIQWREDASNRSHRYARNRLRHQFLPELATHFNAQLPRAIARLADAQRRDAAWMQTAVDAIAADWFWDDGDGIGLRLDGWGGVPEALSSRLVERAIVDSGGGRDLSRAHVERVLAFISTPEDHEGGRTLELPGGLRLTRESKEFRLRRMRE